MLKHLVRHVTAPAYGARDGFRYLEPLRMLEKSQWASREELRSQQLRRLRALLEFCYSASDFYRSRMDANGIVPSDVSSFDVLKSFPELTKADIRKAGDRLFSRGYDKRNTMHTRTGGSTGVPIHVYIDHEAASWKYAAMWRHNAWAGWRPGDKVAAIWGDTAKPHGLKQWLRFFLQDRMIFLDTLKFSPDNMRRFHAEMLAFKPTVMMGHAHSVFQFADFCGREGLRPPRLSGIVTTAMTLSELERPRIEEVFQARVFNRYGCEELSIIASETDCDSGLHVFSEGLIVELEPTGAAGESRLIITDLLNRAMPMIRYSIEDVGLEAHGACPCGRQLDRIGRISGRTADFLFSSEGTPVFGISLLDTYIIHIPGIYQAQLIQNELLRIDVNVVATADFGIESRREVERVLRQELGADVTVNINIVDRLEQTERGKYRFSICNIAPPVG